MGGCVNLYQIALTRAPLKICHCSLLDEPLFNTNKFTLGLMQMPLLLHTRCGTGRLQGLQLSLLHHLLPMELAHGAGV